MSLGEITMSATLATLKLIDGALVAEDTDEWAPKGILLTLDGIEAAKWAWIICGFDEERRVERFTDWFGEKARSFLTRRSSAESGKHPLRRSTPERRTPRHTPTTSSRMASGRRWCHWSTSCRR